MKIYTTYFAKCRKLPATIVPISIAQYPVSGWSSYEIRMLAPRPDILRRYKVDGDWDAYAEAYTRQLSHHDVSEFVEQLQFIAKDRDVALVCYEKDYSHCHRSLVAKWLTDYGVSCEEWSEAG